LRHASEPFVAVRRAATGHAIAERSRRAENTAADIIDRLNKEIKSALADPNMIERLADLGATPMPSSPEDFGKLVADETEKWARVVKFAEGPFRCLNSSSSTLSTAKAPSGEPGAR
jgi:hypothetical protein